MDPFTRTSDGQRLAELTRAELRSYLLQPMLIGVVLLAAGLFLQVLRMQRPVNRIWLYVLNGLGSCLLLCGLCLLIITLLIKATRRRKINRYGSLDLVLALAGFLVATGLGGACLALGMECYKVIEAAALRRHGITANAAIDGRKFLAQRRSPQYQLYFRLANSDGQQVKLSFTRPADSVVARIDRVRLRYLPANPEVFRLID